MNCPPPHVSQHEYAYCNAPSVQSRQHNITRWPIKFRAQVSHKPPSGMDTSPATYIQYSFPYDDRYLFHFLSILGGTALDYDPYTDRIQCTTANRNWALFTAAVHFAHSLVMFFYIQLLWLERYSDDYLPSVVDTCRSSAVFYSYQSLAVIAVLQRQRFADYFNLLQDIDKILLQRLYITIDGRAIRRPLWWFLGIMFCNYMLILLPLTLYQYRGQTPGEMVYTFEYMFMAIMMGMSTIFLRYTAHCCLVRYTCLRVRLAEAVSSGQSDASVTVKAVVYSMGELDGAKEIVNEALGVLLLWKVCIDMLNWMLSVYVMICHVAAKGRIDDLSFVRHVLYEWPFLIAHVWMMRVYQAIGDEVS